MNERKEILSDIKRDKKKLNILDVYIQNSDINEYKDSKIVGNYYPYISIHDTYSDNPDDINIGKVIEFDQILNFQLSNSNFLPRLFVKFIDKSGFFNSTSFVVESSIANIYIKSNNQDLYKNIHMNMDIIEMTPAGMYNGDITFIMSCQLRLPLLYTEECKSYLNLSSIDVLKQIAKDNFIGFSSNETEGSDIMTWINPYTSIIEFIFEVFTHAYKDINSYFTSFIDYNYNLNFVNVNKCLDYKDIELGEIYNGINDIKGDKTNVEQPYLFYTNRRDFDGSSRFITSYRMNSEVSKVVLQNGYKRLFQFYNTITKEYINTQDLFIHPIEHTIVNGIKQGGMNKDLIDKIIKYKYVGKQNENMHDYYLFSNLWNYQNLEELYKNVLTVDLKMVDIQLRMFQTVPILIYEYDTLINRALSIAKNATEKDLSFNEYLSGMYTIINIEYLYSKDSNITQRLYMVKKEYKKY